MGQASSVYKGGRGGTKLSSLQRALQSTVAADAHRRSRADDKRLQRMSATGRGLLNRAINALPFELHIPGYRFCGPGTRLKKRLARGDAGINPLDAACREHDIAYSRSSDLTERHAADKVLADKALGRVIARDSTLGERAAAAGVWATMKVKTKIGAGMKARKRAVARKGAVVARKGAVARKKSECFRRRNEVACCRFCRCWGFSARWSVERPAWRRP